MQNSPAILHLRWVELVNPRFANPAKGNFGSKLIGMGLGTGEAVISYPASGLHAEFQAPLVSLNNSKASELRKEDINGDL